MRNFSLKILAVFAITAFTTAANAEVIDTVNASYSRNDAQGQITQTATIATPGSAQFLVFRDFDRSIGTLTSVDITFEISTFGGGAYCDFTPDAPPNASVTGTWGYTVTANLTPYENAPSSIGEIHGTVFSDSGSFTITKSANPDGMTWSGPSEGTPASNTGSSSVSGEMNLNPYYGGANDTYSILYTTGYDGGATSSSGTGFRAGFTSGNASGSVTITYNYTPVPEPATGMLAFAGIGMLAMIRRRRK